MTATSSMPRLRSVPELLLATQLEQAKIEYQREFRFAFPRRYRADFWILGSDKIDCTDILIEVDGGAWVQGRHTRGAGFENDCEKACEAAIRGYRVLRVTPHMIESGKAIELVRRALNGT